MENKKSLKGSNETTSRKWDFFERKETAYGYAFFERKSPSKHTRRCINGSITGCGRCVGYCTYSVHSGFLTRELRKEHDCIKKECYYYLPKPKTKTDKQPTHTNYVHSTTGVHAEMAKTLSEQLTNLLPENPFPEVSLE